MITAPLLWNGNTFPSQNGNPVKMSFEEFADCCGSWCCSEEHLEYPGEVNLLVRFPIIDAPAGYFPYPDGVICLGPFDVPMYVRHETDGYVVHDDILVGGTCVPCQHLPFLLGSYYNPSGIPVALSLANPLPVGSVFLFTVVSTIPVKVGVSMLSGSFVKITWRMS